MNDLPIRTVNGATVYMRDVANVRDGYAVQQNIVRVNGRRASLLTVLKNGQASTLTIVAAIKKALVRIQGRSAGRAEHSSVVRSIHLRARGDQRCACAKARLPRALTGLMILLFLGSWRSTLIVCISIPLSILTSLIILDALGQTVNVMTLGGLALAVGILVDDATVEIENIHRNLGMKKPIVPGHSRRRSADCGSGIRLHAIYLYRVRAGSACSPALPDISSRRWRAPSYSPC